MKRSVTRIVVLALAAALAASGLLLVRAPVILKALVGSARIISPPVKAEVSADGVPLPEARCFLVQSHFNRAFAGQVLLWIPVAGREEIFLVNTLNSTVGVPAVGRQNYYLLFGRYLFQSELGDSAASFGKFEAADPNLLVGPYGVTFTVTPTGFSLSGRRLSVKLHRGSA
jgi:hypothetical protein